MATLAFLDLKSVSCETTEDLTGSDDLFGVLGPSRFSIGTFNDGEQRTVDIHQIVPVGVTTLEIFEGDALDPDDLLGSIELNDNTDVEHPVPVRSGRASYIITLVVSTTD